MSCRNILVQARMTSSRFPGKVLAPLRGEPLIAHVLRNLRQVSEVDSVILVTSRERSDDPLARYAQDCLGAPVFRGDLDNVFARFQACLREFPCAWFARISGDSPVIDSRLVSAMWRQVSEDFDLVTNVGTRTFPPGQSVEILRTSTFLALDASVLTAEEQEHVTLHFYRNPRSVRMRNVRSVDPALAAKRFVVDSIEDLKRLEAGMSDEPDLVAGFARLVETTH